MDRNDPRRISPVPWVLIVLLGMLLAGLVFVRLFAPADGAAAPEPVETTEPTPEPTPDAAETLLADMTLREKLCQLLLDACQSLLGQMVILILKCSYLNLQLHDLTLDFIYLSRH